MYTKVGKYLKRVDNKYFVGLYSNQGKRSILQWKTNQNKVKHFYVQTKFRNIILEYNFSLFYLNLTFGTTSFRIYLTSVINVVLTLERRLMLVIYQYFMLVIRIFIVLPDCSGLYKI